MVRNMILAGLMGATLIGGISPAMAQQGGSGGRGDRGQRSERPVGGAMGRPMGQPGGGNREWHNDAAANRAMDNQVQQQRQVWANERRDEQRQWQNAEAQDRREWLGERADDRREWRNDRADNRRAWRDERADDRRNWADNRISNNRGWVDRAPDGRRFDNRGWNGNGWNDGRRYDDRSRWTDQRRWDNGWRRDARYDWYGYRARYGDRYRIGRYDAPRGWDYGYRRYSVGIFLNNILYSNSYWLNDPYSYRLPPAYGTLRWVRYYDDALLVDIRDGYVADVIHDFFW